MHDQAWPSAYGRTSATIAGLLLALTQIGLSRMVAAERENPLSQGRELFVHEWNAGDPLSPRGDGLGPMFNARSCRACHSQGGVGGAGAFEHNVAIMSLASSSGDSSSATDFHPGFSSSWGNAASVVLHRFGTEPDYERWRMSILGYKLKPNAHPRREASVTHAFQVKWSNLPPVAEMRPAPRVTVKLSHRNTPALFGAGLIDSVSQETLEELADKQSKQFPGVSGRVARTSVGKIGRFGWRGQIGTLREFVLAACAMELGLQTDGNPQAVDPLHRNRKLKGIDLTLEQCDALTAFVASLPAPRQFQPSGQDRKNSLATGEKLFETAGCAACHVRDVGPVQGIFSDLLLHDLGPELEDPLPAVPPRGVMASGSTSGGFGYGGGSLEILREDSTPLREWRTPPLWGIRDSGPYLHDGRAPTLQAAILAHGGEAESSVSRFQQLGSAGRSQLLAFLESLTAP